MGHYTRRLGWGEYYAPGQKYGTVNADCRRLLLDAITRVKPEALDELSKVVSTLSSEDALTFRVVNRTVSEEAFAGLSSIWDEFLRHPSSNGDQLRRKLCRRVVDWVRDTGLVESSRDGNRVRAAAWALDAAIYTICQWLEDSASERNCFALFPAQLPFYTYEGQFVCSLRLTWSPGIETAAGFEKKALAAFRQQLDDFVSETCRRTKLLGWQKTSGKYDSGMASSRLTFEKHFTWLALRQACRQSCKYIANEYGVTESTGADETRKLASVMGLHLLRAPKGRSEGHRRSPQKALPQ